MSARARLVSWWTRCVVSEDPHPCHARPEASTYPHPLTLAAVTHAAHVTGAGVDLLTPTQAVRFAREIDLALHGPTGEWGDVDVFPHTNGGTR